MSYCGIMSPRSRLWPRLLSAAALAATSALAGCGFGGSSAPATPTAAPSTASATPSAPPTNPPQTATPQSASASATPPPSGTATGAAVTSARYQVGAYYFSGWSHAPNNNMTHLLTTTYRSSEPLIGWYDDSQAQVDKSINQAADAGIDFFAFDWYDLARSPYPTDQTLNEALGFYLTSTTRHRLKFCLNFVDEAPFIPRASDWPSLVHRWVTTYFTRPDYVRVDGKPLFIVLSPEHMRDVFGGSQGVRKALDELRAQARAAGLPGVTVAVAATVAVHANPVHVQELNAEGYDAATGYNYHAMGGEQYRVPVPYERLVAENMAMWDRVATSVHVPYIPVATSGWDQRFSEREQQTAIIYDGRTPAKFACYALKAREWVANHPTQTVKERIVMLFAWNEIGEGGGLIPNHRDGYGYANAIRAVFRSGQPSAISRQLLSGC